MVARLPLILRSRARGGGVSICTAFLCVCVVWVHKKKKSLLVAKDLISISIFKHQTHQCAARGQWATATAGQSTSRRGQVAVVCYGYGRGASPTWREDDEERRRHSGGCFSRRDCDNCEMDCASRWRETTDSTAGTNETEGRETGEKERRALGRRERLALELELAKCKWRSNIATAINFAFALALFLAKQLLVFSLHLASN